MLEAIKSQPPEIIPRLCSEDSTCVAVDCGCYNRNLGNNTSHRIYTELRTGDGILRIHAHLRRQATSLQSRLVTTTTRKVGTVASGIAALEDPGTGRKSEESSCCWEADSCIVDEKRYFRTRTRFKYLEDGNPNEDPRSEENKCDQKPDDTPDCE
jgi:hypothetical protein